MTDQPKFDHQCVEIGDKRSTVASVTTNGFSLTQFHPQPGGKLKPKSIAMNVRATKVLDQNLDEIRRTICDLKNGELKDAYSLPLGQLLFLSIDPGVRCVSIRKFFRPKFDRKRLFPGSQGLGLTIEEFERLFSEWHELMETVALDQAETCEHEKDDQSCVYCFGLITP